MDPDRRNLMGAAYWNAGIPGGLLNAIFQAESGGNLYPPNSPKGAMGPFQIMPDVAKAMGINAHDPLQSEQAVEKILTQLFKEFHDWEKVLGAYNWGSGHMEDLLRAHPNDWKEYLAKNPQTAGITDYIRKIEISMHMVPGASATVAAQQLAN
jgi:membrane-bound lytic murein transglycosylase MltF